MSFPLLETISSNSKFSWTSTFILDSIKTFLHCVNELLCCFCIIFTVKDTPFVKGRLLIHFWLNFSINILNILYAKFDSLSISLFSHNHFSWIHHCSLNRSWFFSNFNLPVFHFFHTFFIFLKWFKQTSTFFYSLFGIWMSNLTHIFHQSKVCSHWIT